MQKKEKRTIGQSNYGETLKTDQVIRILIFWQSNTKNDYKIGENSLLNKKHFEYITSNNSL